MSIHNDPLWKKARKRVMFKRHLVVYLLVNLMLWVIWWFTVGRRGISTGPLPWPAWSMLGWGIGLGFEYLSAYGGGISLFSVDREYEKLKEAEGRNNAPL